MSRNHFTKLKFPQEKAIDAAIHEHATVDAQAQLPLAAE